MWCAPLAGWRPVRVTARRTHVDGAHGRTDWLTGHCPDAVPRTRVMEHRNTPPPASLADAVPPEAAPALVDRGALHATPKHSRWLNMAELECRA
jgi:hypothetical protein